MPIWHHADSIFTSDVPQTLRCPPDGAAGDGKVPIADVRPPDLKTGMETARVVDLGSTPLRSGLRVETGPRPSEVTLVAIIGMPLALKDGQVASKRFLYSDADCAKESLLHNKSTLSIIRLAKLARRYVYLVAGSREDVAKAVAKPLAIFKAYFAMISSVDLSGVAGADQPIRAFESTVFDYIGNDIADLSVWENARRPIAFRKSQRSAGRVRSAFATLRSSQPRFERLGASVPRQPVSRQHPYFRAGHSRVSTGDGERGARCASGTFCCREYASGSDHTAVFRENQNSSDRRMAPLGDRQRAPLSGRRCNSCVAGLPLDRVHPQGHSRPSFHQPGALG